MLCAQHQGCFYGLPRIAFWFRLPMLSSKLLSQLSAKGRKVAPVPRPIMEIRNQLIALIDDYWRYYCNPTEYSFKEKLINPETGKIEEIFNVGRWRDHHHIVQHEEGQTIISVMWNGRLLPLTKKGDQELVIGVATRALVEEVLAEIKHAVKTGAMDSHIIEH